MGCTSGENVRSVVVVVVVVAVADFYCDYYSLNLLNTYYYY